MKPIPFGVFLAINSAGKSNIKKAQLFRMVVPVYMYN